MRIYPRLPHLLQRPVVYLAITAFMANGCAVGPEYHRPDIPVTASYKESPGWIVASPGDTLDRGAWWTLFDDPVLDRLASELALNNQNVAAATAAYAQARALVSVQRAALLPVIALNSDVSRSGSGGSNGSSANGPRNNYQVSIGGSWEPDVWGRLGRAVSGARAGEQASAADLAAATLAAQGELAINYFSLRQTDAQRAILDATIKGYQRTLEITQNRYTAGIAARTDLLQAQTQLANAQAENSGLMRQRDQLEHAIAILIGKTPGDFSLPVAEWKPLVPQVPIGVPSTLLQRRPDIAAAERRVAAANEQIGIAQSAFYPDLSLGVSGGSSASQIANLFAASSNAWSIGLSAAQTLFNAGATRARVTGAEAAHAEAVARYRQTVLAAFQQVEDQLSATRVLMQQHLLRRQAAQSADQVEAQVMNRYRAGQISFTEVVIAQTSALNARRALVQVQADQQNTSVALIQSLGGGWISKDN